MPGHEMFNAEAPACDQRAAAPVLSYGLLVPSSWLEWDEGTSSLSIGEQAHQ